MKRVKWWTFVVWALWACVPAFAQQEPAPGAEEQPQPQTEVTRELVKRYSEMDANAVWRAANSNVLADVRFPDAFKEFPPNAARREIVRLGPDRFPVALRFNTQADIQCLVDARNVDTLQKVSSLVPGQQIIVEGTILGNLGGRKSVLVDRVLTGDERRSRIDYELVLRWPGTPVEPKLIVKPGRYVVEFPSSYKEDAVESFEVQVERKDRKAFAEEQAREAAEAAQKAAGQPGAPPLVQRPPQKKSYRALKADDVYVRARQNDLLDVRFQDQYKGLSAFSGRTVRTPYRTRVPVGFAFDTYIGLTCVVPANDPNLLNTARRIVPGQKVSVDGTVLGQLGAFKVVLVDNVTLPSITGVRDEADHVWLVTLNWPEQKRQRLYQVGTYVMDFPSTQEPPRFERLVVELREVRVVEGTGGEPAGALQPEAPEAAPGPPKPAVPTRGE